MDLRPLVLASFLVVAAATPAAASPTSQDPACGAQAGADLIALRLLDLRPLGLKLGPVADVRVATSRSRWTADRASASAGYLMGLPVPTATAQQVAPPNQPRPATASLLQQDLGLVAAGDGDLSARATSTGHCDGYADASASLLHATVLSGRGGRGLVRVERNLASRTTTERRDGTTVATASISLTDVRLFAGTQSAVTVKVLSPPTLRVTAGGSRPTVSYTSPILEVSGPLVGSRRLDSPATSVEFSVPPSSGALGDLVGSLGLTRLATQAAPASVRLRLALGQLDQSVTGSTAEAKAASLRLQVVAVVGTAEVPLIDLGIGLLEASATASAPEANGPGCGGPGCRASGGLPVTGTSVGVVAGAALLLIVAGRFLLLLGRRNGPLG